MKSTRKARPGRLDISGCVKPWGLKEDTSRASEQFVVVWRTLGNPLHLIAFSKRWCNRGRLNAGPPASLTLVTSNRVTQRRKIRSWCDREVVTPGSDGDQEGLPGRGRTTADLLTIYLRLPGA